MRGDESPGQRVAQLDGLRGLAALGVLVFHYVHFKGDPTRNPWASSQPFTWIYVHGWLLVDFFFLLSGVVMTRKYMDGIAAGALSGRRFMLLRLSRIYPLHVLCLCLVALIQWWRLAHSRPPLLYPANDLYHFVLNVFFLQAGAFEQDFSFDGPSWSVAVEMVVYVVFFLLARRGAHYPERAAVALLAALGLCVTNFNYPLLNVTMARGVLGFFVGSLCYVGLRRAEASLLARKLGVLAVVLLAGIVAMCSRVGSDAFIGGTGVQSSFHYALSVFPLVLIAALEFRPLALLLAWRPFAFLGDISYAAYLIHIPIQLLILSYAEAAGVTLPTSKPAMLLGFAGTVVLVAALIHRFFEVPARARLRGSVAKAG